MNVIVCVKHAVDESELKVDGAGRPVLQGAQARMSTFDRNAVEEAVRIKEKKGGTVTVISLGANDWKKSIKEALAMGCDRALAVNSTGYVDVLGTSYFLARATQRAGPYDLVICSEGSSDTYHGLVGPMVAEWLSLPFMGYVRKIDIDAAGVATCELALEESVEVVEAKLPAVISVVSEINSPRYPTLLQIIQASKKPIEEVTLESLRVGEGGAQAPEGGVKVLEISVQAMNRKKVLFEDPPDEAAKKLLDALKGEGVL
jgi:electron transfer flavoprotein beta subunit